MEDIFRILLVDDEVNVLASLRRHLFKQKDIEVFTAQSGAEGLEILQKHQPFAVLCSDYKMPEMEGAEFLSRAAQLCPETTRIMLTGNADVDVALNAINRGSIYRFLLKPITPQDFLAAVQTGIDQYRLVKTRQELMDELSIMQRIDRQLNMDLDIQRAMKITLDWAMSQSGAVCGFMGTVEEDGIRIMAAQGFSSDQSSLPEKIFADSYTVALQQALSRLEPQVNLEVAVEKAFSGKASCQVIIPICRENAAIGILLLEQTKPCNPHADMIHFLVRLGDHASIAIANARLLAAPQAANQAKSEFISFTSHELRNPLTSIGGFTELLMSGMPGPVNEMQVTMLQTIKEGTQRMTTLLSDLSDISRIESGHLRLEIRPIKINEIITAALHSYQPQIHTKKQTVTMQIPENLPDVSADHTRLTQVIANLISNAHKYTPEGGQITLHAEECTNHWDVEGAGRVVHFSVMDTGIGISDEDQKKIFQKFFRTVEAASSGVTGTGLGLNITRNLIEKQGGRIWFESTLGKGTTFHITIPVAGNG